MEKVFKTVILEKNEGVAFITLNQPQKMNAVDQEMIEEMIFAAKEVEDDPLVKVVVLTGSGRGFCAGGDLDSTMYDIKDPGDLSGVLLRFGQLSLSLRNMPKPVIAMVEGIAAGAGFSFVLACDIIIASDKARFGHVYQNIGVQSDCGATYFLPRMVGTPKACELIFTGDIIDAHEAERIGLVNRVVPAEDLREKTMELALRLAGKSSFAIGMAKKSIYQASNMDLATAIEFETRAHTLTMLSDDMQEGIAAFKEKRSPEFKKRQKKHAG